MQGRFITRDLMFCSLYIFVLASCSLDNIKSMKTFKNPTFEYKNYEVIAVGEKKADLDLIFDATNPNNMALESIFANYELFIEDKSFIKGKNLQLKLTPNSKSVIHVPVEVYYKNVLDSAGGLLKSVLGNDDKIAMAANVTIFGDVRFTDYISTTVNYNKRIDLSVPIPKESIKDKLKDQFKKLF